MFVGHQITMVQKSFVATILTLFFTTISTSIADDSQNSLREDTSIANNKFGKIFFGRDADQLRRANPQLLDTIAQRMYRQKEIARLRDQILERREETGEMRDVDDPLLQLISDWMRREEMKRKRAHHRALCHFKICNMGSKRSYPWDTWPNDNQVTSAVTF